MLGIKDIHIAKVFGTTICSTGLTEKKAKELGINVETTTVTEWVNSENEKNNEQVTLKLIWNKDDKKIIGAQMQSELDVSYTLHKLNLVIKEGFSIEKLVVLEDFFFPRAENPIDFVNKAGLQALQQGQ